MYHDIARLNDRGEPRFTGQHRFMPDRLDEPLRKRKGGKVFVCDMGDLFFEGHPDDDIRAVFNVMQRASHHTFQVLTKRTEQMADFVLDYFRFNAPEETEVGYQVPRNIWFGTSVEDQKRADERIPHLLRIPARVRFLSVEPQIEAIDVARYLGALRCDGMGKLLRPGVQFVIQGGESGHHARPFDLAWARSMRDECAAAGVPYFLKQLGANIVTDGISRPGERWPTAATRTLEDVGGRFRVRLKDSHGGDPSEWPEDLRDGTRAFPEARA
jgi:protein gp37